MTTRRSRILAAALFPVFLAGAAEAQPAGKPAANATSLPGGTWASIPKLPDWAGVWAPFRVRGEAGAPTTSTPVKLLPSVQAKFDAIKKIDAAGGDKPSRNLKCITRGLPGDMGSAETQMGFSYMPGEVVMTFVDGTNRHIYTDGRSHPDPSIQTYTYQGDSIGHWDGDTLLVDTIALDRGNEFISGFAQGANSHVTEHIKLTDPDSLAIENVLEAPQVLSEPFKFTNHYKRHRDWQMIEWDCSTLDNRDVDPVTGHQIFDFTLPSPDSP